MSDQFPKMRCCVVGAGVIGLSVATELKNLLQDAEVTVIAESFYDKTTSYGSGGFWEPYQVGGTSPELISRWGQLSYNYFLSLHSSACAAEAGVQLFPAFFLYEERELPYEVPSWKDIVVDFKDLKSSDLRKLGMPEKFVGGYSFLTVAAEQKYYLKWLMKSLQERDVIFKTAKIESLVELANGCEYDIIVNCTGLGAADLLHSENGMYPVRGQVLRAKAPWMKAFWNFGPFYMIPNCDSVVLGGTAQVGDYSADISDTDTKDILDGLASVFPAIRDAPIHEIWAGLRPCRREGVRLECELIESISAESLKSCISSEFESQDLVPRGILMAHCYGHGGCGVTLSMGCAVDLVQNHMTPFLPKLKKLMV